MTTTQDAPTIGQLIRDRVALSSKSAVAREIGVSRQMLSQWSEDYAIPGPEWVDRLATYLDRDRDDVVIILYHSWLAKNRLFVMGQTAYRPLAFAA